jgi:hypothetical protein
MKRSVSVLFMLIILAQQAQASIVILNGLSHTHDVPQAGTKIQGTVRIKNQGSKDSRIVVYGQDMVADCGKGVSYTQPGTHKRSLGGALTTNVDERNIGPEEEYDLRYTIALTDKHSQLGTYWQVLMVEVADPIREEAKNGLQVNSKIRYAIQVIVNVGTLDSPQLSYEHVDFTKVDPKHNLLKVTLKNNSLFGTRAVMVLEVYDVSGKKVKVTEPGNRMLYPGYCSTFEIPIDDLPKGKYDCVIVADTQKDLFGSNVSLQIE